MIPPRAWIGVAVLWVALAGTARAQVDYDAIRSGVTGCPELAADPTVGDLAAALCRPLDRTSLDQPISTQSKLFEVRAGSFSIQQRDALLALVRGAIGEAEFARLRGLLFSAAVLTPEQETLRRDLLVQAADPATDPTYAAALRDLAAALVEGTFDASIPALLAARADRIRWADFRAGLLRSLGPRDVISAHEALAADLGSLQVSGVPVAVDADGFPVFDYPDLLRRGLPLFLGADGRAASSDDLPYLRTNTAAQSAGYVLAQPFSSGRFNELFPGVTVFTASAQRDVESFASPGTQTTVEAFGVFGRTYLVIQGCDDVGGQFELASGTCVAAGSDVTGAAAAAGCDQEARREPGMAGINQDGDCIALRLSAFVDDAVPFETFDLLADRALRPAGAALEPVDLTDLALRARGAAGLPARPPSPTGNVAFAELPAVFARKVDLSTGAPLATGGTQCRLRTNASAAPIGPNGIAGDADDVLPSAGECLLWNAPDGSGVQRLRAPGAVASDASPNQSLFHTLCTLSFDGDAASCTLDALNLPASFAQLSSTLGGLNLAAPPALEGLDTVRTRATSVVRRFPNPLPLYFLAINPVGQQSLDAQDPGMVAEPEQAALLGCGVGFASACGSRQLLSWQNRPPLAASLGVQLTGGIDLLNAAGDVVVQEFATVKALRAGGLVGTTSLPGGALAYLPGANYSRNGVLVNRPGAVSGTYRVEDGDYLSVTPDEVLALGEAGRATFQHGPPNKVQADGWVEAMPWAIDPDALAQFGAIVFQSDPTDPLAGAGNVFVSGGEYCGRWMSSAIATPFNQTCTLPETISANLERLLIGQAVIGRDRVFDPPETVAELEAMLDADAANDPTGDPISGPDGIFARNQRVFRADAMDFEVVEARDNTLLGIAQLVIPDTPEVGLEFLLGYDPNQSCSRQICFLRVNEQLTDPGDAFSSVSLVLALPIGTAVERIEDGVPSGLEKVNLARLAWSEPHRLHSLFAGEVVDLDGRALRLNLAQRQSLLGQRGSQNARGLDFDGDGTSDLDRDRDGVFDGADDFTPGPVSDDEVFCGSGIRGDLVQDALQLEPWSDADLPGSPAFEQALPIGLAPRSPVFCRGTNALLALVGPDAAGSDAFLWHGGAAPSGDRDADGWPDALDSCPFVADRGQEDGDGDGVGDACDNCTAFPNPRVSPDFLAANPWATLTGGQRDDDHDGYGNLCDAKFVAGAVPVVGTPDLGPFRASLGRHRATDACGASGHEPCAIFDLDEAHPGIDSADQARFRELQGYPPGPKCETCPQSCEAGPLGSCD